MTIEIQPTPGRSKLSERRAAVKKIIGGAGLVAGSQALPEGWVRPVISTAVIPAHAAMSVCVDIAMAAFGEAEFSGVENLILNFTTQDPEFEGSFEIDFETEDAGGLDLNSADGVIEDGVAELQNFDVNFTNEALNRELNAIIEVVGDVESGDVQFICLAETSVINESNL